MSNNPKTKSTPDGELLRLVHEQLVPDPKNRDIEGEQRNGGERWKQFVDSVRASGVVVPGLAVRRDDGKFDIVEGERRWRASQEAARPDMLWLVFPPGTRREEAVAAGVVANLHRREPSSLDTAKRLRELRNTHDLTQDQIAQRTGISVTNVQQYLALFDASDLLRDFIEAEDILLRLANELIRFEKRFGEKLMRQLLAQRGDEPLTIRRLAAEKKKLEGEPANTEEKPGRAEGGFQASLSKALKKDTNGALAHLQELLKPLGYRVVLATEA
jgi:ParB/RepB/Spo0J family partition protein